MIKKTYTPHFCSQMIEIKNFIAASGGMATWGDIEQCTFHMNQYSSFTVYKSTGTFTTKSGQTLEAGKSYILTGQVDFTNKNAIIEGIDKTVSMNYRNSDGSFKEGENGWYVDGCKPWPFY